MKILVSCSLSQFDLFGQKMAKNVHHGSQKQKLHVRNACFQSKTQRKYTIIKCRIVYKKDAHHDLDNLNSCWLALK